MNAVNEIRDVKQYMRQLGEAANLAARDCFISADIMF